MSASPVSENACRSCGSELTPSARYCPSCGAALAAEPFPAASEKLPQHEPAPGPVTRTHAEQQWLGAPASLLLLCAGFAALGGAAGLFAAGHWPWGLVLLGVAILLLVAYGELARREARPELRRSALLVSGGRSRAATLAEVARARVDAEVTRRRARTRLDVLESERRPALQALGVAVWEGDSAAEERARTRLAELDERRALVGRELEERLAETEERIRRARLTVDSTMVVAPEERHTPDPPPVADPGSPPDR